VIYAFDDEMAATALSEMYRVLAPSGSLVLNVAALPWLRGNHSVLGGEVQRYTRSSLGAHLTRAGFTIHKLTYTNLAILPIVAAKRLTQRLRGLRESNSDMYVPPAAINLALAGLLSIEAAAVRVVDMPLGSSVLTLAQKPR
jgi:hypothetical protein